VYICEICKDIIKYYSPVCEECVQKYDFISTQSARSKYNLKKRDIEALPIYNLRNKDYYCHGKYFLESDIEEYSKKDKNYARRMDIENNKKYSIKKQLDYETYEENYSQQQRMNFVTAVFNKIGYVGDIEICNDISTYITHGIIFGRNMYEFELYLVNLIRNKNSKQPFNHSTKLVKQIYADSSDRSNKIHMIKNILGLDHYYLKHNDLYNAYINYGIGEVTRIDNSIRTMDQFYAYLLDFYN
jgi:hypothetical protein